MAKVLECSSQGDTRFSAMYAEVKLFGKTQTIEQWYQFSKRFGDMVPGRFRDAKGKRPSHIEINGERYAQRYLTAWYKLLWLLYLDRNPDLVAFASKYDRFTDKFRPRNRHANCQADVIEQYVKQGRDSIMKESTDLIDHVGWKYLFPTTVINKHHYKNKHLPFGHIFIGRGSKWGNPFSHMKGTAAKYKVATRKEAVAKYEEWILTQPQLLKALEELEGHTLMCFCDPAPCHGHVLVKLLKLKKKGLLPMGTAVKERPRNRAAQKPLKIELPVVHAWTDGSCLDNGRSSSRGGWAFVAEFEDERIERSGPVHRGSGVTSARMEMRAVIELLKSLKCRCKLVVTTDYDNFVSAFMGDDPWIHGWESSGWKKANGEDVANQDLWNEILRLIRAKKHKVKFIHTKSHAGNQQNNRVDKLAYAAAQKAR